MLTLSQVSFSLGAAYTKPFWIISRKYNQVAINTWYSQEFNISKDYKIAITPGTKLLAMACHINMKLKSSEICRSGKTIFPRRLVRRENKSTEVRHKFTSDGQMPDDLSVQGICSSSSVKMGIAITSCIGGGGGGAGGGLSPPPPHVLVQKISVTRQKIGLPKYSGWWSFHKSFHSGCTCRNIIF